MSTDHDAPDKTAQIIAGLLILAMIGFGAVAKHDNPSWNKMIGNARTVLGLTRPKIEKKSDAKKQPEKKTGKAAGKE